MARSVRMAVGISGGVMLAGAALGACGSGVQTRDTAATTTTLSVDDERLAGDLQTTTPS